MVAVLIRSRTVASDLLCRRSASRLGPRNVRRTCCDVAGATLPFYDSRLSRGVTWLGPTVTVELTYSELMENRLRDPVYRGLA